MGNHNPNRQRQRPVRDDRGVHIEAEYDEGFERVWNEDTMTWSSVRRKSFPSMRGGKGKK